MLGDVSNTYLAGPAEPVQHAFLLIQLTNDDVYAVCGDSDDAGRRGVLWHSDRLSGGDCAACQHSSAAGPDVPAQV